MTFVPCPMLFHPTEFAMLRPTLLALVTLIGGAAGIAINGPAAALSSGTQLAHRKKTQPLAWLTELRCASGYCMPALIVPLSQNVRRDANLRRAPAWPR
jgi:hypothetical protein